MLSTLGDLATLRLFRSRNGSAWVFSSDTNTEEEPMVPQIMRKRQPRGLGRGKADLKKAYFDSPTGNQHGEHSTKTIVGTTRSSRQA